MVTSNINISSANNVAINTSTSISTNLIQTAVNRVGASMHISDTQGNIAEATLNLNTSSLKLEILKSQEYAKKASLFFGNLFQSGFNADYMWQLLAASTNEQINSSHLSNALSGLSSEIQEVSRDLHLHKTNYNIHVSQEDRDFLTRLKGLYGGVYNVALDYLVLKNPYLEEINITRNQLALYAGFGGYSAYSGETDLEVEFFNLLFIPTKSGGQHTSEAYHAQNNTYGYGITTLNVPTAEPLDLTEGETAIYVGAGGFNSYSSSNVDSDVVVGYYFEGNFYLDAAHTIPATLNPLLIYVDLSENKLYRYDSAESKFIPLTASGGVVEGFFNDIDEKFYSSYEEDTYSDEISGEAGLLYLDKTTNTLYRFDETEGFVAVSSASQDAFIIRGYRNSSDGLFYKDVSYEETIEGNVNNLYYDLLTSEVYYFTQNAFQRLHHKVAVDYLLFKPQTSAFTIPEGKAALYFGEGGFNASDLYEEEKEIIVGYYYNHRFYEEAAHTNIIPAEEEAIYVDLSTYTLYIYDNGSYEKVSATGDGSTVTSSNIEVGYYNNNHFYRNRTGSSPNYSYNTVITPSENYVYIDRGTGRVYKYSDNSFIAQSPDIDIDGSGKITVTYTETQSTRRWEVLHNTLSSFTNSDVVSSYGNILSGLTIDDDGDSHYYGHVTGISKLTFNEDSIASTIVKRLSDAAIKAKYLILDSSASQTTTLEQTELALFVASGGFTATSYAGNNEYFAGDGLYLNGDEFNIRLDFHTSGENYAVQADSDGNLFVRVPAPSQGTIDHNALQHRFSENFTDTVVFQHDIDVIRDLRTTLNTINTNISTNANALKLIASSTWSALAPIIFTHTETVENEVTTYSNVISIQPLQSVVANSAEALNSGTLMSTASTYEENVDVEDETTHVVTKKRVLTKVPVNYSNAITNNTIVKRRNDGALAATYLLITDGVGSASVNQGEAALYIGDGGFTSTSVNDNYEVVGNWPSQRPAATDEYILSPRILYDKVQEIYQAISGSGGTPVATTVEELETSTKNIKIYENQFLLKNNNQIIGKIHNGSLSSSILGTEIANNGLRAVWQNSSNLNQGLLITSSGVSIIRDSTTLTAMASSDCPGIEYVLPNVTITDNDMEEGVLYVKLRQVSS